MEHVSLGTNDLDEAENLVEAFVRWLGYDTLNQTRDPLVTVVISRFVDSLPKTKEGATYRSNLKWFKELLDEDFPGVRMSELTTGMQKKLIAKFGSRWAVHSARTCMVAFGKAVRFACDKDDDGNIFSFERPQVVMSRNIICDLLDLDDPDVRNWHPDPSGMASVLREIAPHEAARRWAFLALFTALRPSHILEVNPKMIATEFNVNVLDTRRRRETATDENRNIEGFFRGVAPYIKRHPQLPIPDIILSELESWGETPWVGVSMSTIQNQLSRAAEKFNMPLLIPSSFRDFCKALMQCTFPFLGGVDVPEGQRLVWMGHKSGSKVHDGYGRFHPGYLRDAADAVVLYMKWLDKESGGALFRQVSAKPASASNDNPEADIVAAAPFLASRIRTEAKVPEHSETIKKWQDNSGLAELEARERTRLAEHAPTGSSDLAEAPHGPPADSTAVHGADEMTGTSTREMSGLTGSKLLQKGHIEGFRGVFRRVTGGYDHGYGIDKVERFGTRYMLPTLADWFEEVGIEIYDTVPPLSDEQTLRIFVDENSQSVIGLPDVKMRMVASIGCAPGGWDQHSFTSRIESLTQLPGPFYQRDTKEPSNTPRGLLDLIGSKSILGDIQSIPSWFEKAPSISDRNLCLNDGLNWIFLLDNLQVYFDIKFIDIYEAVLVIDQSRVSMRFFVEKFSERVVTKTEISDLMVKDLGCDPGGWMDHTQNKTINKFDVAGFIKTKINKGKLEKQGIDVEVELSEFGDYIVRPYCPWFINQYWNTRII